MKKVWLLCALFLAAACFGGCAGAQQETEEPAGEVVEETAYSYFKLNIRYVDETENGYAGDFAEYILPDGTVLDASMTDGSVSIEEFPAATGIQCSVRGGSAAAAEHRLSFWTGYQSDYYNNLNTISVDMPGNIAELFLTVKIQDDGSVKCVGMSETSFDETAGPDDFEGAVDKEEALGLGLYGMRAVTETGVKLREDPSTDSEVLRQMNFADQVMLLDQGSEKDGVTWFHVTYNEYEGYIAGEYLGRLFTVNNNGVNVREEPTAESESVNLVSTGARVVSLDDGQDIGGERWYRVVTRSGITGYIRSDFLD